MRLPWHGLLILLVALVSGQLSAQSSVWKVSKGDHHLYLGGTMHLLRAEDFPLPEEFTTAYDQSDKLIFEVAPEELKDPAVALKMMTSSTYQDGRTLKSVLNQEAYDALAAYCQKANIPIAAFNQYRVGAFLMFVAMNEYTKLGFTSEGVETHLEARAEKDGKEIGSLETAEFQIQLVTEMGEGIENELVFYSLEDMDQLKTMSEELQTAWRTGNMEAIDEMIVESMEEFPDIYNQLLRDRNLNWIPQLEAMITTPDIEFVLVGAAHMPGKHGVIPLLENKGYTITPVVKDSSF